MWAEGNKGGIDLNGARALCDTILPPPPDSKSIEYKDNEDLQSKPPLHHKFLEFEIRPYTQR